MQKIKILNISELARAIDKTPQTLWNWKNGSDKSRLLLEGAKIGVPIIQAGYHLDTIVAMINSELNNDTSSLIEELNKKNKEIDWIKKGIRKQIDELRDKNERNIHGN